MSLRDLLRRLFRPTAPGPRPVPVSPAPGPDGPLPSSGGVVDLVNARRRALGLRELAIDGRLQAAAGDHAEEMARVGRLSHYSAYGRTWQDRAQARGFDGPVSEVIAWGYPDAASVVEGWMRSPGHRRALMDPAANSIGVAVAGTYWCAVIGLSGGAAFLRGTTPPPPLRLAMI